MNLSCTLYCLPSIFTAQVRSVGRGPSHKNNCCVPLIAYAFSDLIHYKGTVSFIQKQIKSEVMTDASNESFVPLIF